MSPNSWTFLHAADLHIDSPLRGLSAYEGAPVERLRLATREAFRGLVDEAIQRGVALVILAGDVFDGDWPDFDSGLWFAGQLQALDNAGIRVFVVRGNHDALSRITLALRWPNNVHVFDETAPESVDLPELGVALHGQSFAEAATLSNLAAHYPAGHAGRLNIGVLHTALSGRASHDHYAPCSLDDLRAKGYDYWALGHVHKREVVSEDPWVVFPGNIQGRHIGETGAKSATLVHVQDGCIGSLETIFCDVARWVQLEVDATGVVDEDALIARCESSMRAAFDSAEGRLLAARVTLRGSTALDPALRLDELRLRQEIRVLAGRVSSDLWIEKVILKTTAPLDTEEGVAGLAGLAQRILTAEVSDEEFAALASKLERLSDRLPPEVRAQWNPLDRSSHERLLEPARRYLAALLGSAQDEAEQG